MVTPAVMYEADLMHLHKTMPTTSTVQPVTAHSRRAEEKQQSAHQTLTPLGMNENHLLARTYHDLHSRDPRANTEHWHL